MKVKWQGQCMNFVSIYVPVHPAKREEFFIKLKRSNIIPKKAIVMGDFNCVENPLLDVKHAEGADSVYANSHAPLLMQIMARAGLGDVYRKLHGRKAAGFTRECESVRTRIDRIYATEFSSDTVWYKHELDQRHAKNVRTDHIAVVAEMSPLGASRSRPAAKNK